MLFFLISLLSDEERIGVRKKIQQGRSSRAYLQIFDFYSSKDNLEKTEFTPKTSISSISKVKFYVSRIVIDCLKNRNNWFLPEITEELKEAIIFFNAGYPKKAIGLISDPLAKAIHEERYSVAGFLFDWYGKFVSIMVRTGEIPAGYSIVVSKITKLRQARNQFEQLERIYFDEISSIKVALINQGQLNRAWLSQIRERVRSLEELEDSAKVNALKAYILAYCNRMLGDHDGAVQLYSDLQKKFHKKSWLKLELPFIYGLIGLQGLVSLAKVQEKKQFEIGLNELRTLSQSNPKEFLWKFLFGCLLGVEYFDSEKFLYECNKLYLENLSFLKSNNSAVEFLDLSFYLAKLKAERHHSTGLGIILREINCFSKADVKMEIRVYSRVLEVIQAYELGEYEFAYRLTTSLRRFLANQMIYDRFPQAILVIRFFSKLLCLGPGHQIIEEIEEALLAIRNTKEGSTTFEKEYFGFESYLMRKLKSLNKITYQNRA